jgi:hypothetical protein
VHNRANLQLDAGGLWRRVPRPVGGLATVAVELVLIAGVVGAVYRVATPPPRRRV